MKSFVQFGAGNIGRSFIGRLFSDAGYEVIFVDVDSRLITLLNQRQSYPVIIKTNGKADETRLVQGIRAIKATDIPSVIQAVLDADCVATSVGQRALGSIMPLLASALELRRIARKPPLDVIIAENLRAGAAFFRTELAKLLPPDFDLESSVGLVETSIGKMVPIMPTWALELDPLQLFAEPYDTLIVDRRGFRNPLPPLAGLQAVDNIAAYVDRKLFMHNMSHAATAYLGYQINPGLKFIWQAIEIATVYGIVRKALEQSAAALLKTYPDTFDQAALDRHADELLERYRNQALGDTVYRVGRDLTRKLARDDRLIGACLLAAKYGLPCFGITQAVQAALNFQAVDEGGLSSPNDQLFFELVSREGAASALQKITSLDPLDAKESQILQACLARPACQVDAFGA